LKVPKPPAPPEEKKEKRSGEKICCGDFKVIFNYLIAEQNKKSSGLKIGIFTVFLVVAIITMLDSVISIVPILFVKLGQEEAGAIDF
jgi:hypothetical protein